MATKYTEVEEALRAAGYDSARGWSDAYLVVAVGDASTDDTPDPEADDALAEIQSIAGRYGWAAEWSGDGNTDADGHTTSDVLVAPEEEVQS